LCELCSISRVIFFDCMCGFNETHNGYHEFLHHDSERVDWIDKIEYTALWRSYVLLNLEGCKMEPINAVSSLVVALSVCVNLVSLY
jgi:hypothetical protein